MHPGALAAGTLPQCNTIQTKMKRWAGSAADELNDFGQGLEYGSTKTQPKAFLQCTFINIILLNKLPLNGLILARCL